MTATNTDHPPLQLRRVSPPSGGSARTVDAGAPRCARRSPCGPAGACGLPGVSNGAIFLGRDGGAAGSVATTWRSARAKTPATLGPTQAHGGSNGVWLSRYEFSARVAVTRSPACICRPAPARRPADRAVAARFGRLVAHYGPHRERQRDHRNMGRADLVRRVLPGCALSRCDPAPGRADRPPAGRQVARLRQGNGHNTGPWELVFQDPSTSKTALAKYDRRPEPE